MTMLSINTNMGALNASQSSYSVNKSMETSMARLSSGKRINTGSDDAAGLFITKRMSTEIQGLNQAVRNASDALGISKRQFSRILSGEYKAKRLHALAIQMVRIINENKKKITSLNVIPYYPILPAI